MVYGRVSGHESINLLFKYCYIFKIKMLAIVLKAKKIPVCHFDIQGF